MESLRWNMQVYSSLWEYISFNDVITNVNIIYEWAFHQTPPASGWIESYCTLRLVIRGMTSKRSGFSLSRCSQSVFLQYATSVLVYFSVLALVSSQALSISVTARGGVGGGVYNKVQYNNISVYVWSLLTLLLPCLDGGKRPLHDISAAKVSFSASLLVTIHFYIHAQEACAKACRCSHGENSSMLAFYSAYELYA